MYIWWDFKLGHMPADSYVTATAMSHTHSLAWSLIIQACGLWCILSDMDTLTLTLAIRQDWLKLINKQPPSSSCMWYKYRILPWREGNMTRYFCRKRYCLRSVWRQWLSQGWPTGAYLNYAAVYWGQNMFYHIDWELWLQYSSQKL
jgi:hypothetical protein